MSLYALPFLIALFAVLALGNPVIKALAARKAKQPISDDAPEKHKLKAGTPTMGGLLIIAATVLAVIVGMTLFGNDIQSDAKTRLLGVLGVFLFGGFIGVLDDLGKARKKLNKAGLSERVKLALQVVVAVGFLTFLGLNERPGITTSVTFWVFDFNLHLLYYALAFIFILGFGNAANFTDGLDGLLSGVTLIVALTMSIAVNDLGREMFVFYLALAGACAGFLYFNANPARVFMGDTGSLAIGMGLGAAAIAAKQELLLCIVGTVYVAEIASMMIQRYVFKYRRITKSLEYAQANRVFAAPRFIITLKSWAGPKRRLSPASMSPRLFSPLSV
jgi:phospho-N-acetylmuramoyl-pentapeptide-transferase